MKILLVILLFLSIKNLDENPPKGLYEISKGDTVLVDSTLSTYILVNKNIVNAAIKNLNHEKMFNDSINTD